EKALEISGNGMVTITAITTPATPTTITKTNVTRWQGCLRPGKVIRETMLEIYHFVESVVSTTLGRARLPATTVEGPGIRPRIVELLPVLLDKGDREVMEGKEEMLPVLDMVKKGIIKADVQKKEIKAEETKSEAIKTATKLKVIRG
ncbi:hypothetical protein Tco_0192733, partial [Tanacetum coccineum]